MSDNNEQINQTKEKLHQSTQDKEIHADANYEFLAYLSKDKSDRLLEFLKYSGIDKVKAEYDELNGSYNVEVLSKDFEKASNLFHIFSENELDDSEDDNIINTNGNLYDTTTEKYKDNLSSAITFFVCGFAGIVILILNNIGVFSFINTKGSSGILMNVVLGALFVGFIVIGYFSLKYSKKIKSESKKENDINTQVTSWLNENVLKNDIESSYDTDIPEEMKYFSRSEYLHKKIKANFPNINDNVIDTITDNYIEQLF